MTTVADRSTNDRVWTLADIAIEVDEETTWIAPLPHGPVIRVEGVATLLLEFFREQSTIPVAVAACVELFSDAPDDAHEQLTRQATDFVSVGLLIPTDSCPESTSH